MSTGIDQGTCPRTAPCLTFTYAVGQTPAGGEVVALDAGGFGPVTITKSITISSGGPARAYIGNVSQGTTNGTFNSYQNNNIVGIITGAKTGVTTNGRPHRTDRSWRQARANAPRTAPVADIKHTLRGPAAS